MTATPSADADGSLSTPGDSDSDALDALGGLAIAAEESAADQEAIVRRVQQIILARRRGRSWREIFAAEQAPGLFTLCSRVIRRLVDSVGRVRRTIAAALREEGVGLEPIGRLFGVSHQRVSCLLTRGKSPKT